MNKQPSMARNAQSVIATNKVLRNTYILLSMTVLFSAVMAGVSMMSGTTNMHPILFIIVAIALPFAIQATARSPIGLLLTFCYTGFLGWAIGPLLFSITHTYTNGSQLIMMAFGMTGLIFLVLSAISMNPSKDFSHWSRFLGIGVLIIMAGVILNVLFFKLPALAMAMSVVISIISGAYIMYQTNAIVRGGERNYVVATVVIFASLFNIFITLLQLLAMFAGNRN